MNPDFFSKIQDKQRLFYGNEFSESERLIPAGCFVGSYCGCIMFKHLLEKRSQVHVESRSVRDMQQFDSAGEQQATEEKRC
jgi:hypothetical protein